METPKINKELYDSFKAEKNKIFKEFIKKLPPESQSEYHHRIREIYNKPVAPEPVARTAPDVLKNMKNMGQQRMEAEELARRNQSGLNIKG